MVLSDHTSISQNMLRQFCITLIKKLFFLTMLNRLQVTNMNHRSILHVISNGE